MMNSARLKNPPRIAGLSACRPRKSTSAPLDTASAAASNTTGIDARLSAIGSATIVMPAGIPCGSSSSLPPKFTRLALMTVPKRFPFATMPVVFEAAADAPLSGKLVDFIARHAENPAIRGGFQNRAEFIIAAPGQSMYSWRDVDRLAVAVLDELPFKIDVIEPKVPLTQNGSMNVKVVATRKEGFKAPITLLFPFL